MDFAFPKEYQLFRRMVRDFGRERGQPLAIAIDREHRVPHETIKKAAELGLMGVPFPQKYGGMGGGEMGYCILMEELGGSAAAPPPSSAPTSASAPWPSTWTAPRTRSKSTWSPGPGDGHRRLWPDRSPGRLRRGRHPDHGRTGWRRLCPQWRQGVYHQRRHRRHHHRHGRHRSSLGAHGGITAFIVETDLPGFSIGSLENKMGIRGSSTAECVFEDVRVPHENVLGQFGRGSSPL